MRVCEDEIRLYADYCQFYVQDGLFTDGMIDEDAFWTDEAHERRFAVGNRILGIGASTRDFVKVRVEAHDETPPLDLEQWDHVAEAGLEVTGKLILILGCLSGSGLFFEVKPAHYRVRACHANLAESEQEAPRNWKGEFGDWYLVQFWPSRRMDPEVLKRRAKASKRT